MRRVRGYAAAIFCGGVFGLAVAIALIRSFGPGTLPLISAEQFHAARDRWSRAKIQDYDLDVVLRGQDSSTYRVEVRQGLVRAASRNGLPLRQQRTWGTWSVQGMFETIERDLNALDLQRLGNSQPGAAQLSLRGDFDQQLGYPRRYQRTEMHKFQPNQEVSWEVVQLVHYDN